MATRRKRRAKRLRPVRRRRTTVTVRSNPRRRKRRVVRRRRPVARRRRNPHFGKHRPVVRYTRTGWTAGKRSKTFRKKRTSIRRNPSFNVKRITSPKVWIDGLKDAAAIGGGMVLTGMVKTHLTSRISAMIPIGGQGQFWLDKLLGVITAAAVAEGVRVTTGKPAIARLVFAGGVLSCVRDIAVQYLPAQFGQYLSGFMTTGVSGFMDAGSRPNTQVPFGATGEMFF